jgi:hypothetical protein
MTPFQPKLRTTAERLGAACRDAGHQVELVYLPWSATDRIRQLAAFRWIDLASSSDRTICLDRPALVVADPRKVVWMTGLSPCVSGSDDDWSSSSPDDVSRQVEHIGHAAVAEAAAVYVSAQCALRPAGATRGARLLRVPAEAEEARDAVTYGGDFVCLGPLAARYGIDVLVDAMSLRRSDARLRFLGSFDDPAYENALKARVQTQRLDDRIIFERGVIDHAAVLRTSLAVVQPREVCDDVFIAAARHTKVVLASPPAIEACPFGGEIALRMELSAEGIADAIDALAGDRVRARELGGAAAEEVNAVLPTWATVAMQLLQ